MVLTDDSKNIGNRVTNLMDSPVATASRSENGNAMFALVNDEISHFAENTRILVNILDDVAKVHPFIQGVFFFHRTAEKS